MKNPLHKLLLITNFINKTLIKYFVMSKDIKNTNYSKLL